MVHGEGMLVAKMAAASDTARQWSSFAPQNRRCLHGRGGQPLKARADAGNEVAEVEKMRNTRWRGAIGPRQVMTGDQSKPDHTRLPMTPRRRRSGLRPVGVHQPRCLARPTRPRFGMLPAPGCATHIPPHAVRA
jgi:hypothetical protein